MKPGYSWSYEDGSEVLVLQKDGADLAYLSRYSDIETGEHAWWAAETPDGRSLGLEEYLVDICKKVSAEVGFAVEPPPALLEEEPTRQCRKPVPAPPPATRLTVTNADFARYTSSIAARAAKWTRDILDDPADKPSQGAVERFREDIGGLLERLSGR